MRPVLVQKTAAGASQWVPVDYLEAGFGVGFRCTVGGHASPSLTYKVQHAFCSGVPDTEILITRTTTTATLTFKSNVSGFNHGLSATDAIVVTGAGAPLDGAYDLAGVTSGTVVTYAVANSGATVNGPGAQVLRLYVGDHPVVAALTASSDGNYNFPPNYVRTNITVYSAGSLTLSLNQGIST